jgi:hypothetical protein
MSRHDVLEGLRGAERAAAIRRIEARFWVAVEPGGRWHGPFRHWWEAKQAARAYTRRSGREARVVRYGDGSGLNWRLNAHRPKGFAERRVVQAKPAPNPKPQHAPRGCLKRPRRTRHA